MPETPIEAVQEFLANTSVSLSVASYESRR